MNDHIDLSTGVFGVSGAAYAPNAGFAIRDLGVLQYTNGFTFWHLKAGDRKLADIAQPGFFNEARDMLAVGDVILASGTEGAMELVVRNVEPEVRTAALKVMAA